MKLYFRFFTVTGEEKKKKLFIAQTTLNLKLFSELYSELCDAIDIVNSTFTIHLIFVLTLLLLTDIFAAYCFLREFQSSSATISFVGYVNAAWTVIMFLIKIPIAFSGDSTTSEAERSQILVTKAIAHASSNNDLRTELSFILMQMKIRKKVFANVFFNINWSLILTVL